jgi:dipeptidyl aminopeptidase/acylaminoacyl peptidase
MPHPILRRLAACLVAFAASVSTLGADPWTLDDIATMESVRQLALADDGSQAAWIQVGVQQVDGKEKRVGHVHYRRLDQTDAKTVQLTRGAQNVSRIAFSPDGAHLALLIERKVEGEGPEAKAEGEQIWLLPLRGGEPWRLTAFARPVELFAWVDAETLLVARAEAPNAWEQQRDKLHDTAEVIDDVDNTPPTRLFKVKLDGKAERLTDQSDYVDAIAVAPDGKNAVITAQQSLSYGFNGKVPPKTFLVDLATGQRRELLAGQRMEPIAPIFSADGRALFFVNARSGHSLYRTAAVLELHRLDLASGALKQVALGSDRGLSDDGFVVWPLPAGAGSDVVAVRVDGVRQHALRYAEQGGGWQGAPLEGKLDMLEDLAVSRDGRRILYVSSALDRPGQVFAAKLDGAKVSGETQLSELNAGFEAKDKGRAEIVNWKGALDETVEGILHYPLGWQEGKRYPLILDIHGGPAAADRATWSNAAGNSNNLLWRQQGAFILQVNYHGSSSYGLEWVESIRERYYELEIPDLEKGVDAVIARGLADPEKLAVAGWSNGGILAAELITRTRRYKAAVVGAADVEWISDWGNVEFGATFDNYYFGGPPWERTQHYLEKSPFFRLDQVTTPTIVHTGTLDTNVPPHQSWSLFRALQDIGKAPVRFLVYPGEPHGLQQMPHRRRRLEEDYAFFDRHLFGGKGLRAALLPVYSLLASALERRQAARATSGRLGVEKGGVLLPEGVERGKLLVGRFEVTRAQFAAFDQAYAVKPGEEELPASGITFEKAKAYAAWAAEKAGIAWRLPTQVEAEALAEKAGNGGNTLDRWLGYAANPDDAKAVREAAVALSLLLPVGSLQAQRETLDQPGLFDLDGNVAEWAIAENGQGKTVGPSATRPNDATALRPSTLDDVGLRLVAAR